MAMPEQFSLRWNDFHANLSHGFHALLEGEDLVDVTLAAGGHYVHAHKLILSVCSPYFKELFKSNPCEHPIVILKDVEASELRQLLQFMYRGEVHVRQQDLYAFLHTAELLQVKGLSTSQERSDSPTALERPVKGEESDVSKSSEWEEAVSPSPSASAPATTLYSTPPPCPAAPVCAPAPAAVSPSLSPAGAARSPLKRLLKHTMSNNKHHKKTIQDNNIDDCSSENEQDFKIEFDSELYHHSVLEMPEAKEPYNIKQEGWNCKSGGVKCPSCHRFFANRYNLKVHIRDKHDTLEGSLHCGICNKRMRNPSCLRVHLYHHRKQAALFTQMPTLDQSSPPQVTAVASEPGEAAAASVTKWDKEPTLIDHSVPQAATEQ